MEYQQQLTRWLERAGEDPDLIAELHQVKDDPKAVVTLILDNVDVTCTVAPALIFYNVYECDRAFVAYDNEEDPAYQSSAIVDTTAAGDTFNGAFVTALAEGMSQEEAIAFGNKAASISVTRKGAQTSIPSREEVDGYRP